MIGISAPVKASADHSDIDTGKIDDFIVTAMQRLDIPGAALGIVKGDQLIYQQGYGYAGPDNKPVTPQTSFVIGSVSKSFTALAIMQLVDQGKIDLEAPVQQYLPWFRLADEAASAQLLVKHLLHQTSGLSTYDGQKSLAEGDRPIEQHLRSLSRTELTEPVGSVFQYSNLNYDILGGIIEAASGMSYAEYINKHIFIPLHMKHSHGSPDDVTSRLAAGYQPVFGFMLPTRQSGHQGTVPSGYLISSAEDMTNYLIAQLNKGRYGSISIVSEQSAELMHRPAAAMWGSQFYAMGWTVNKNRIYHDGSTENTYSKVILEGDYGIVLLINSIDFFHIDSYDQLMEGVSSIIQGSEPQVNIADPHKTYLIIGFIALIVLAYTARSVYTLLTWKSKFKPTGVKLVISGSEILLLNVVIPLVVLLTVPKLLVPWSVIFVFLVGIGHFMFVIPVILLAVGILKTVLILQSFRHKQHPLHS
ncbi:serine hydrolase domain-containing protein [Paenibacillus tarimensis]|uniref:serine hydrolase domain-containing protein n=1 Tax=Paenibacillus tarimensis TaxID=416012 RepID=UPI00228618C2|nr:beta-lactamase family protein [Paenibacillus tarimensis]